MLWTLAITGWGRLIRLCIMREHVAVASRLVSGAFMASTDSLRSWPVQKSRPCAARITTRTERSSLISSRVSCSS